MLAGAGLGFVNCFQAVSGPGPGQVQAEHQLIIRDNTMPPQKLSIPTLQPATSHTCTGLTSVLTHPAAADLMTNSVWENGSKVEL